MYKYIVLCLCVSLSGVLCDLNKEEGADCDWDGVKGKCVKETRCFTTLERHSDHPVCSTKGDEKIVCCTDCELINSTRNVVMSPRTGYFWKDGTKARDSCLEYLDTLPYKCRDGGFYSLIRKHYDEEKKCHTIGLMGIGGSPSPGYEPGIKYPHLALLGYGNDVATAKWEASGTIISNKYILTAAHLGTRLSAAGPLRHIALGVKKITDGPAAWQIHNVKRLIRHPDHSPYSLYNDIALVEIEDTITFNKNVLPACLPVAAADDEKAIYTTWAQLVPSVTGGSSIQAEPVNVEKFSEDECNAAYPPTEMRLDRGIDYSKQMCYGTKEERRQACQGHSGEPLVISTQFSSCIYTVIGVTSFGWSQCGSKHNVPDVYTRVAYYKPWIESVVWP